MENLDNNVQTLEDVEINQAVADNSVAVEPVKEKKIQNAIIVGGIILIVMIAIMAVVFVGFKFFSNSVSGTWIVDAEAMYSTEASSQDPDSLTYYSFNDDGSASMAVGTMKAVGDWEYHSADGVANAEGSYIDISISSFFNGTYEVKMEGNGFVGKKLTLVPVDSSTLQAVEDSQEIIFKSASAPSLTVEPYNNFKSDKNVVGEWECKDNNTFYTFREDGTCHLNQMDRLYIDGAYSVEKEKINVKYLASQETSTTFEYTVIDENTITISGLEYKRAE